MENDELDEMPEPYENELQEHERNELDRDGLLEQLDEEEPARLVDDETPLGHELEQAGGLLDA
jgi:hypothetical protein